MSGNHETWAEQLDRHEHNADVAAMLRADRKIEEAVRASELREVRIATLVEAARLVCDDCDDGESLVMVGSTYIQGSWVLRHIYGPVGNRKHLCAAEPIILRLVEEWS